MTQEDKVEWLKEYDPDRKWSLDDDMYCRECDGVFKARDVASDLFDSPACPVCMNAGLDAFVEIPWWRQDLVKRFSGENYLLLMWWVKPIWGSVGKPGRLPARTKPLKVHG